MPYLFLIPCAKSHKQTRHDAGPSTPPCAPPCTSPKTPPPPPESKWDGRALSEAASIAVFPQAGGGKGGLLGRLDT